MAASSQAEPIGVVPLSFRTKASVRDVLDRLYLVLLYCFSNGAIARVFGMAGTGGPHESAVTQGINGVLFLLSIALSLRYLPAMWRLLSNTVPLFLLLLYFCSSVLWSSEPLGGLRDVRYILLLFVGATYLAVRHDAEYVIETLVWCSLAVALLSFAGQFLLPPSSDPAPGWTGIFTSKNFLGSAMVVGIFSVLSLRERVVGVLQVVTLCLCIGLLLLSQSFTCIVCVVVTGAVVLFVNASRTVKLLFLFFGLAMVLTAALSPHLISDILAANDRTTNLTGRDEIWEIAYGGIARHPFFGYGINGFWPGMGSISVFLLGWNPLHAHNGYIEMLLTGGILGLLLLLIVLADSFFLANRVRLFRNRGAGVFLLLILTALLLHNGAETDFMAPVGLWLPFLLAYMQCRRYVSGPEYRNHLSLQEASGLDDLPMPTAHPL